MISFLEVVWTFWILEVGVSFEEDSNFWCILFANFFPIGGTVEKEFLILVLVVFGHFGKTMRASTSHTNPKKKYQPNLKSLLIADKQSPE